MREFVGMARDLPPQGGPEESGEPVDRPEGGHGAPDDVRGSGEADPLVADGVRWSDVELPASYGVGRVLPDGATPREAASDFRPDRAGLPEVSREQATRYVEEHRSDRPWLGPAADRSPEAQRAVAALDRGEGHALERHEGWITASVARERLEYLRDPAQLDADKRERAEDAYKERMHSCGEYVTWIWDADAFVTAFVRGIERPEVRDALDAGYVPGRFVPGASVPIKELLGPDGHRFCAGFRLLEVGGSMEAARDCRDAWAEAHAKGREPDVLKPRIEPIDSFEGGTIEFFFRPNRDRTGYEVNTTYPEPPDRPRSQCASS
ncbi:MAG: hypothetical protein GEV03_03470 [Streptosporangiales bacterium]|nr:hypothetical protein [Streptosporangiales bacterium]